MSEDGSFWAFIGICLIVIAFVFGFIVGDNNAGNVEVESARIYEDQSAIIKLSNDKECSVPAPDSHDDKIRC